MLAIGYSTGKIKICQSGIKILTKEEIFGIIAKFNE